MSAIKSVQTPASGPVLVALSPKEEVLLSCGTTISDSHNFYMHIPFWFKQTSKPGIYEMMGFNALPEELQKEIEKHRPHRPDFGTEYSENPKF